MSELATNPTNTNYNSTEDCDECRSKLLPVLDEIYCPVCDVGETCLPDHKGEFEYCKNCRTKLAGWYMYEHCPICISN